jgi:hypothetical protein
MHETANFGRFDFALRNWHETGPDSAHAPAKDRPMIGATIREDRNLSHIPAAPQTQIGRVEPESRKLHDHTVSTSLVKRQPSPFQYTRRSK